MDYKLRAIQTELILRGFAPGDADGLWGPKTRDAIAAMLGLDTSALVAPWFSEAVRNIGVKEAPGAANDNPAVVDFFVRAVKRKQADSVPWCAAFVGAMLESTGYAGTGSLMARSYLKWGKKLAEPQRGCVVVFKRGAAPAGHCGFVESWDADTITCLGGNQSDAVTYASFPRSAVLGFRWPTEAAA